MSVVQKVQKFLVNQIFGEFGSNLLNLNEGFVENDSLKGVSMFIMVITLFFGIIYLIAMMGLWIRIVYYAFQSGMGEGMSSIFFYNLYVMYFIGSTLSARPNSSGMFSS